MKSILTPHTSSLLVYFENAVSRDEPGVSGVLARRFESFGLVFKVESPNQLLFFVSEHKTF